MKKYYVEFVNGVTVRAAGRDAAEAMEAAIFSLEAIREPHWEVKAIRRIGED